MLENFDPNTIEDEVVRQAVLYLMNVVENQNTKIQEQAEEIQRQRDEINRLKGEQGKPKIRRTNRQGINLLKRNVASPNRITKPASSPRSR